MNQDGILVTGNIFGISSFKAAAYNALGFSSPVFLFPTTVGTLVPPIVQDSNANVFLLAGDSAGNVLDLYQANNISNQGQFSMFLKAQIAVPAYAPPPTARQNNSTQRLDTLDGRFLAAIPQYGNTIWAAHTIALGSFPAPKFYQIDTSANSIVQSGTFFESSTSDDFNASITANSSDEVFVTWNSTDALGSARHNAYVKATGRQAGDTAGTMGVKTTVSASFSPITGNLQGGIQRWGDYSMVALDPVGTPTCAPNRRAALFNEKIINANTWGSQFADFGFCR